MTKAEKKAAKQNAASQTPVNNNTEANVEKKADETADTGFTRDGKHFIGKITLERHAGMSELLFDIPASENKGVEGKQGKIPVPKMDGDTKIFNAKLPSGNYLEITVKRIKGTSLGRPAVEGSERQIKMAALEAKRKELEEAGMELTQGRPVNENSERQREMRIRAIKLIARIKESDVFKDKMKAEGAKETDVLTSILTNKELMKKFNRQGRPVDSTSERQARLANRAEKEEQFGPLKRGRPAQQILLDTIEIVGEDETSEETETALEENQE